MAQASASMFMPDAGAQLAIDGTTYRIAPHPSAPGMPYGQEGREATVYQLTSGRAAQALKVFKPRFRTLDGSARDGALARLADVPGLEACKRTLLSGPAHARLLHDHGALAGAVLMPWIDGPSWMEVIAERRTLSEDESRRFARSLGAILAALEERDAAHCDLSAANVLLPGLVRTAGQTGSAVALVDVESIFFAWAQRPAALPGGSPGYAHRSVAGGVWQADADRFAGAVLLAEMLAWCDQRVRTSASDESYFDPDEMQRGGARVQTLLRALEQRWGAAIASLFKAAWESKSLQDCPTLVQWSVALARAAPDVASASNGAGAGASKQLASLDGVIDAGSRPLDSSRVLLRGADITAPLTLRFEEAIFGAEKQATLARVTACSYCGGSGQVVGAHCRGCGGSGRAQRKDTLLLRLPPGVENGGRVRWYGGANAGLPGGEPGDIVATITVQPHASFTRRGADIVYRLSLSEDQAHAGAELRVPTLEGDVSVRVPKDARAGTVIRIPARGAPRPGGVRGDQLVEIAVVSASKVDSARQAAPPPAQPAAPTTTPAPTASTPPGAGSGPFAWKQISPQTPSQQPASQQPAGQTPQPLQAPAHAAHRYKKHAQAASGQQSDDNGVAATVLVLLVLAAVLGAALLIAFAIGHSGSSPTNNASNGARSLTTPAASSAFPRATSGPMQAAATTAAATAAIDSATCPREPAQVVTLVGDGCPVAQPVGLDDAGLLDKTGRADIPTADVWFDNLMVTQQ